MTHSSGIQWHSLQAVCLFSSANEIAQPKGCATRIRSRARRASLLLCILASIFSFAGPWAASARAQGSRKDDIVFNTRGQPLAGAQIRVCTASATTTSPCTPTAPIYSDLALTQALANPISADGMGNYTFYAAPGRYVVEISGPGITTYQMRDVILPTDPTQPLNLSGGITTTGSISTTSALSAFTLSLTGNLTVAGSAAVTGTFTVGGNPVPTVANANTWTAVQTFKGPSPWRDVTAYGATGNGSTDDGPAFNSAIAAAEADASSEVYVPYSASGYFINTCLSFASSHTHWLRMVFAGNLIFGSGCPTQNIHTTLVHFEGLNGASVLAFSRGGAKASWTSAANATFVDVVGQSITFTNLSISCTNSANTHPCGNWDNNGTSGSSVYLDSIDTDWASSGTTGPGLQLSGFPGAGGFGARIHGGTIYSGGGNTVGVCASSASLNIIYWGMVDVDGVTLVNCGISFSYVSGSAPAGNSSFNHILYESATNSLLTLASGSGGGSGISQIEVKNSYIADAQAGYTVNLITTSGSNPIASVSLDNSSGGSPAINQSANPIQGLYIRSLYDYVSSPLESDIWQAGSFGHMEAGPQNYFWGSTPSAVATNTLRGAVGICLGTGSGTGTDTPLHVSDCTNGGNGMSYTALPGGSLSSSSSLVTREDSAATNAYHTLESPNSGSFNFVFCRPGSGTPTCPGSIFYSQPNDAFGITAGGQTEMYIGDSLGGVTILRGLKFQNSGANGVTFGGSFSTGRTQSFQDASGTIALTSQLPLSATTSSIGGSALAAGACTDGTVSVTGATTSMVAAASPASDPGAGFTWNALVSAANTVDVRVCNVSGVSATPAATAFNVRVMQ